MSAKTPGEMRSAFLAEISRVLRRSLDRHDVSQKTLAQCCGVPHQRVARWCDPEDAESFRASDVALFPPPVARDVFAWLGSYQHVTFSDDLEFDAVDDHLAHMHRVIKEGSEVFAAYTKIVSAGAAPSRGDRRELARELRESIAAQTALLRDVEGEETAASHGMPRRPSEPKMRAVGS